jgi:hypothetical protein
MILHGLLHKKRSYLCNRPWRPIGCETMRIQHCLYSRLTDGCCQQYALAALYPQKHLEVLISLRDWVIPGSSCGWKDYVNWKKIQWPYRNWNSWPSELYLYTFFPSTIHVSQPSGRTVHKQLDSYCHQGVIIIGKHASANPVSHCWFLRHVSTTIFCQDSKVLGYTLTVAKLSHTIHSFCHHLKDGRSRTWRLFHQLRTK